AGEIGPAAARNDGTHAVSPFGSGHERGGASRASAKMAEREDCEIGLHIGPARRMSQPPAQQRYVETVLARMNVAFLLGAGEEIDQQRRDARALQLRSHPDVARTMPAAAAAVREQHDAFRAGWNGEIAG